MLPRLVRRPVNAPDWRLLYFSFITMQLMIYFLLDLWMDRDPGKHLA
jgi:hypothetical protein